jgi:septum formation inhibitor MinC
MTATEDREQPILIDLSRSASAGDAVRQLELALLGRQPDHAQSVPSGSITINTGDLLLAPGMIARLKAVTRRHGASVETLYSLSPQTQQSALEAGWFVGRKPFASMHQTVLDASIPKKSDAESSEISWSKLFMALDDGSLTGLEAPATADAGFNTLYYKQTLRSGQVLEASGNVVVLGDAHSGSEILADGDILVWGFLGGIAHAGRHGYVEAQIRAMRIEAVQLRIAHYMARRPDRLFKQANLEQQGPELACVKDGAIQIFYDTVGR